MVEYHTRVGGYTARINQGPCWECLGRAYLGTITFSEGHVIGWAWRADGRSIDPYDNGFDLIDFPQEAAIAETVAADG